MLGGSNSNSCPRDPPRISGSREVSLFSLTLLLRRLDASVKSNTKGLIIFKVDTESINFLRCICHFCGCCSCDELALDIGESN